MKRSLQLFLLSLVVLTALIAVNRWDLPVMIWLATIFATVAMFSGIVCLMILAGLA